jgi:S-adenosylhomocysteine hydrolase
MATLYEGMNKKTTLDVLALSEMPERRLRTRGCGPLLLPASDASDYVEKSKFNNVCGPCDLPNGVLYATDMMIGIKRITVCGYGEASQGYTFAPPGAGAHELYADVKLLNGELLKLDFQVLTMQYRVGEIDIFTLAMGAYIYPWATCVYIFTWATGDFNVILRPARPERFERPPAFAMIY